ncbi:hypothetical protein CAOG_004154 [Capsaspora owczarzaki ATCC 30864]|uniref:NOD3 protein n=1 Tax=Capsaspora owczarzaki (strain ATCC 30864) TaxID=595528 RepID=A0A0D2WQQ6_CAPO3|nr:hypothetical protein CAOG_004154 [Capsaspora owczarzaki ATCC 30864]
MEWDSLIHRRIGDAGAQVIAEELKRNATLARLGLIESQIGDAGARAIAEALTVNTTLITLSLEKNPIGDAGTKAIAEALKVNLTLATLLLGENQIGDAGVQAIAETLKVSTTLTRLQLQKNQIGDAGAQAIAAALRVNTSLTELNLGLNQIGDVGAQAIAEALKVNKTLAWLDLGQNLIGDAGAKAIAEGLRENTTVTRLHLDRNRIGYDGAQAIDDARNATKALTYCSIDNQINPLAFSLLPRLATAKDLQTVFHWLVSGPELQDQPAALPALPVELAERIMDEACYWQGVQHTKRSHFHDGTTNGALTVTVPQGIAGNSVRVKAIQVLRDEKHWLDPPYSTNGKTFDLVVRDKGGVVRYECAANATFVDSNLNLVTIRPASHPFIRQLRKGWQVQVLPSKSFGISLIESLYLGAF